MAVCRDHRPVSLPESPGSFPMLLLFLSGLVARLRVSVARGVVEEHLVESFERLSEVVLECGERSTDGGRAEAMCDEGEVGQAALDAGFQDGTGP